MGCISAWWGWGGTTISLSPAYIGLRGKGRDEA